MMDALRFIFSSFWIWLGFTTLVAVVLKYLVDAIKAILCQSLGLSGSLSIEEELGGEEQFKFSFGEPTTPICTLWELEP